MKKVKKRKVKQPQDGTERRMLNPSIKSKGELYVRNVKPKEKRNLFLAWKIQEAEATETNY